jgi:hypothetical protein
MITEVSLTHRLERTLKEGPELKDYEYINDFSFIITKRTKKDSQGFFPMFEMM